MSTENILETIVSKNTVQLSIKDDLNTLEERHRLLEEAGFTAKARIVKAEMVMKEVMSVLENPLIVSRPNFTRECLSEFNYNFLDVVLLKEYKRAKGGIFGGTKIVDRLYLVEADLDEFKAYVPDSMLPTVVKGRQLGLLLKVWFVAKGSQISNFVTENLRMDPMIVGYPIVALRDGQDIFNNEHAVVLAIWGKDIEAISKYVEERRN